MIFSLAVRSEELTFLDVRLEGWLVRRHQACGAVDIRYISPMQDVWFR